jgi:hypothetical protein
MADEAAACFSLKMMTGGILTLFKKWLLACGRKSDCASTIMTKLMKSMKESGEMDTDY